MVPWDRTPAGIGSPGVRVLYGMKNGKAGMMLTIRDYRRRIWPTRRPSGMPLWNRGTASRAMRFCRRRKRTASSVPRPGRRWRWTAANRAGSLCPPSDNIGRCSHIANALLWGEGGVRGRGIGRALVLDSLESARALGFRGLQFNAVVAENAAAIALYEQLGFVRLGTVPGGYRRADGRYVDTYVYFHDLRG